MRKLNFPQENKDIMMAARDRVMCVQEKMEEKKAEKEAERNRNRIEQLSHTIQLLVEKVNSMEKRSET